MRNLTSSLILLAILTSLTACQSTPPSPAKFIKQSHPSIQATPMAYQARFWVDDPSRFHAFTLNKPLQAKKIYINNQLIPQPIDGMRYKTIPALSPSLLQKGDNTISATWTHWKPKPKGEPTTPQTLLTPAITSANNEFKIIGLSAQQLTFQSGPILGYATDNLFTVTCRTNMYATVTLTTNNKTYTSTNKLLHQFTVDNLHPLTDYTYQLSALIPTSSLTPITTDSFTVLTLPPANATKLTFAVLGDSRTLPEDWSRVAQATTDAKPAFTVFVGDMVTNGLNDHEWDEQYFNPAIQYFATIPYYPVIGNHERDCNLFNHIFITPNNKKTFAQNIGPVLIIAVDGKEDWSAESENIQWLENLLKNSTAKFIFFATHYPAWSSGGHAHHDPETKQLREIPMHQSRTVIMPLLKKYNVAAMFSGHDHFYERSEPSDGVTAIVAGGAGAPLRNKAPNAINPYSKVWKKNHHYCLINIDGDTATMTVITPKGETIDTRTWKARH